MIYIIIVFALKEGRFCFPKTIEEEELCVERVVPKSTRYKNKCAVGIFEDWQRVRSVKFPIVEIGGVFKEYELDKVQPLTRHVEKYYSRSQGQDGDRDRGEDRAIVAKL